MTESERDLGKRWFEQVWNQGRREAIAEMMAPDSLVHDGERITVGRGAFYSFFDRMMTTFSEVHVTVEDTMRKGTSSVSDGNVRADTRATDWVSLPRARPCTSLASRSCDLRARLLWKLGRIGTCWA
jgi:hypothetical protein